MRKNVLTDQRKPHDKIPIRSRDLCGGFLTPRPWATTYKEKAYIGGLNKHQISWAAVCGIPDNCMVIGILRMNIHGL